MFSPIRLKRSAISQRHSFFFFLISCTISMKIYGDLCLVKVEFHFRTARTVNHMRALISRYIKSTILIHPASSMSAHTIYLIVVVASKACVEKPRHWRSLLKYVNGVFPLLKKTTHSQKLNWSLNTIFLSAKTRNSWYLVLFFTRSTQLNLFCPLFNMRSLGIRPGMHGAALK